ncbi:NFACT family protein [Campylobacter sp. CCS1377]|uniref:NFACT family protein n=1 Tax=Campylobacter sp. CCS1377 TaxID=3158229 RepID=A0AAU7E6X6_9BACT|nr:NFACT family protein [Campylobacter jejuni]
MKYTELLQIGNYLQNYKKIDFIKRIDDNVLELCLDKKRFIFSLKRGLGSIFCANLQAKNYSAPFDFMLKKYFCGAKIDKVELVKDNRILVFHTHIEKSYKSFSSKIYFEFTGKNTNVIITDNDDIIIEALRHIDKSYRMVKVGQKLIPLKPFKMDENFIKIENFDVYFKNKFEELYAKDLMICKENKATQIRKKIANLEQNLQDLEKEENLNKLAKSYTKKADVLFANLYNLKDFEREFTLCDFEGKMVKFKLEQSPKNSANQFYKMAKKLKQKAKNIQIQRDNILEKLKTTQELLGLILQAKSIFELEILLPKKTFAVKKEEANMGVVSFYFNEFKICVGKNEKANQYLLQKAKKDDIWMHVKDRPSAHVFIISNKLNVSDEVLNFGAKICVNFSNLNQGNYLVDYTSKKFVKIREKAFVNYINYKTISVLKE